MVQRPHRRLAVLVGLCCLSLRAQAEPVPAEAPTPIATPAVTPPQAAMALLQDALAAHGRQTGFDADYGALNRLLLARLADAIELVDHSPRPSRPGARLDPVQATWRTMNRDFVAQLSRDNATVRSLAEQPLRRRLAEQALYERIVVAVRKNLACLRDMAAEWTSPTAS